MTSISRIGAGQGVRESGDNKQHDPSLGVLEPPMGIAYACPAQPAPKCTWVWYGFPDPTTGAKGEYICR